MDNTEKTIKIVEVINHLCGALLELTNTDKAHLEPEMYDALVFQIAESIAVAAQHLKK